MSGFYNNGGQGCIVLSGYSRDRQRYEKTYHEIYDLYGPSIGLRAVALWGLYKRFVYKGDPDHLLYCRAWPSHRKLSEIWPFGKTSIHDVRRKLEDWKLVESWSGEEWIELKNQELEAERGYLVSAGMATSVVQHLTLADLAALGITNPKRSRIVKVNDPLTILPFCERFGLSFSPQQSEDGQWNLVFDDDFPGDIRGDNRLEGAVAWITKNLSVRPEDRRYSPLATEDQIVSLMRCSPTSPQAGTIKTICQQLVELRAAIVAGQPGLDIVVDEPTSGGLPEDMARRLSDLGWVGSLQEVEHYYAEDPERVDGWLTFWSDQKREAKNPAGAFRRCLRDGHQPPETPSDQGDWRRYVEGKYGAYIEH